MIIRDGLSRFVASFDSTKMLEKAVENEKNAKIAFESCIDHTSKAAYVIDGDCDAVWNEIVESGVPCMSRI